MYLKVTDKIRYFIKNKASFKTVYRLSSVSQYHPNILIAQLAYNHLSAIAESLLPADKTIYNFGEFIPFNHTWEAHGIDGKRTLEVELDLIESFKHPGPTVQSRDDFQRHLTEVLSAIDSLSQFDAMKHLCTGNLRRFVRERAISRLRDSQKDIMNRGKRGLTPYEAHMRRKHMVPLSMGVAFNESPGAQSIETFMLNASVKLSPNEKRIVRFMFQNQGLTYAQISKGVGMSESAIQKVLERTRKKRLKSKKNCQVF